MFFGCHSSDGVLYDIPDEDMNVAFRVTMQALVDDWQSNTRAKKTERTTP